MPTTLKIGPFGPMIPRRAERLLNDNYAQVADNVNLLSGEIEPIRQPAEIESTGTAKLAAYRAENVDGDEKWRTWDTDVDVVLAPLAPEVEPRYVWTGDGVPKWTSFANFDTPASDLTLGIPTPTTAPTVTPSGGSGIPVSRLYVYTFYSQDGEESSPSPASDLTTGLDDDTWAITGMDALPLNTGVISTAVKDTPANGQTQVTTTAAHWLRAGDSITITGVGGITDLNATWTVTGVVSATVFYVTLDTAQTYTSGGTWTRDVPWNITSMVRRLYRSAGTNASYQLVADNISATTYNDSLTDLQIEGDELISDGWVPPPTGLSCVISLPSGSLAGIKGSTLYMSEPYQPHAWPSAYQFSMAYQAVACSSFGNSLVVGTLGQPYVSTGVDPAAVALDRIDSVWPCIAKRSMVSVGDGVIYATSYGLAYIGSSGLSIMTQPYYTREEWEDLLPSSMVAAVADSKIFVRYKATDDTVAHILQFMPSEETAALTRLHVDCQELYTDPRNGKLYILDSTSISEYNSLVGNRLEFEWLSKEYELPTPVNFGAARVEFVSEMTAADAAAALVAYNAAVAAVPALIANGVGALNGGKAGLNANGSAINGYTPTLPQLDTDYVNFTLYSNGSPVFGALLYSNDPFRMPAGFKTDAVSVKLNGTVRVKNVKLAETMKGLKAV